MINLNKLFKEIEKIEQTSNDNEVKDKIKEVCVKYVKEGDKK